MQIYQHGRQTEHIKILAPASWPDSPCFVCTAYTLIFQAVEIRDLYWYKTIIFTNTNVERFLNLCNGDSSVYLFNFHLLDSSCVLATGAGIFSYFFFNPLFRAEETKTIRH